MPAPPLPPKPELPEAKPAKGYLSLMMAGMLAAMIFTGLFFITLGWIGPVLVLGAGVFGLAAFHYVIWGWWLSKLIRQDVEREEAEGDQ